MAIVLQFDISGFTSFHRFHSRLYKRRLCKNRSICSQHPLRKAIRSVREALRLRFAKPYHRNLTSAGYSASSVEKYHYHSDCHCHFSSKLNFRSGILARSPYIAIGKVKAYPPSGYSSELMSLAPVYSIFKLQRRRKSLFGNQPLHLFGIEVPKRNLFLRKILKKIF